MSSMLLISLRNQPPIWQLVDPLMKPVQLYLVRMNSSINCWPPPCMYQAFFMRLFMPNGRSVPNVKVGSLPK